MSENTIRNGSTLPEKPVESNSKQKLRNNMKLTFPGVLAGSMFTISGIFEMSETQLSNTIKLKNEDGTEHQVWQHVFTPANWTFADVAKCLCATEHSSTWTTPSGKTLNQWQRERSQAKRAERWQKIRRRQRRAAQRKHNRGER